MNVQSNEKINEIIKKNEQVMIEFVSELKTKLEQKTITIDGIEEIMINTVATIKRGVIAIAEDIMSEEGKKKLK
jgi:hypothetical protein